MYKFIFSLCAIVFLSCTNQSSAPAVEKNTTVANTGSAAPTSWTKEDEMDFLSGCVDNAKGLYGETKAFTLCKCILGQVQQKYPNADSTAMMTHLSDTSEVAKMAQQCSPLSP